MRPPDAPLEPVERTVGGATLTDPYPWLEPDDDRTLAWQSEQVALADAHIRGWPGYAAVRRRIEAYAPALRAEVPERGGPYWFRRAGGRLEVSDRPDGGTWRVLHDAGPDRILRTTPSPDGARVAFGSFTLSDFRVELRVLETATGTVRDDAIAFDMPPSIAWLPDGSGFYLTRPGELLLHRLGEPQPERQDVDLGSGLASVEPSVDGRYALLYRTDDRGRRPAFVADMAGARIWRPFLKDGSHWGVFHDGTFYSVTTDGAPRGRVLAIPLDDPATAREVVPAGEAVIGDVHVAGGLLFTNELHDVRCRIRIFSLDGEARGEVELPDDGLVGAAALGYWQAMHGSPFSGDDELRFAFASFSSSAALYRYDVAARRLDRLTEPASTIQALVVRRGTCASKDGTTRIPYRILHRDGLGTGPHPALVSGYGGFNQAPMPQFAGPIAPFLDAGGVYVVAGLRGGCEYGTDHWHAGRQRNKQKTFDDMYTLAEHLVREGITTPDRLAVGGGSNGGLMVGVAVTQRPELFRAAVAQVPLLDALKMAIDFRAKEYADPADDDAAAYVLGYSPYHNVVDGTAYPAVLLMCNEKDVGCPPWQGRKMAARLQRATTSGEPVLLRVYEGAAHVAFDRDTLVAQAADRVSFVMERLGMAPP